VNPRLSPVAIFAYNRPIHLKKLIESLNRNNLFSKSKVYVFVDGPKSEIDKNLILEIKIVLSEHLSNREIEIKFRNKNIGLANSVISGVSEILKKHSSVIVIEDDLEVSTNFLQYMNRALQSFFQRKDIFSISAYNFNFNYKNILANDFYLSYRSSSWGWATWADRWGKVDWEFKNFNRVKYSKSARCLFERGGEDLYQMMLDQQSGKIDSWSIRFDFAMFENNATCLYPKVSLVKNNGFDGSGTHKAISRKAQGFATKIENIDNLDSNLAVSTQMLIPFNRQFRPFYTLTGHCIGELRWPHARVINRIVSILAKVK
jgi:GNT-I family